MKFYITEEENGSLTRRWHSSPQGAMVPTSARWRLTDIKAFTAELSAMIPCSYWASIWLAVLPTCMTSYEISVRQTRDLPVS